MAKTYYVYKITNTITNEFYIGYRGTTKRPMEDIGVKYFSSGKLKKQFIANPGIFKINIMYECAKERKCFWQEQYYIMQAYGNPKCMNGGYSVKIHKQTVESLTRNSKPIVHQSSNMKRIWCDIASSFIEVTPDEFERRAKLEKAVNGYGGRAKKVYA